MSCVCRVGVAGPQLSFIRQVASDPMVDSLVQFLASHDAHCPKCGYNLRSVQSPRCPECGLQLTLSLVPDRPSVTSWCALLVMASLLSGIGVRYWVVWPSRGFPRPSAGLAWYWYVLYYAVLSSPLVLIAVLFGRHWLMHRRPSSLWGITALAAIVFVLDCLSLLPLLH